MDTMTRNRVVLPVRIRDRQGVLPEVWPSRPFHLHDGSGAGAPAAAVDRPCGWPAAAGRPVRGDACSRETFRQAVPDGPWRQTAFREVALLFITISFAVHA